MAAMLWIFLYNPTAGYLNYLLDRLGIPGPNWLGDPQWALLGVAIATVWREIGFNVIFFLAGLTSIPRELREAAVIDGAGRWQRFRHVVLPLISPTFFFVAVVSVINSFQSFGQIHILTAGGPANATGVLVYKLYRDAFENFRTGYASAQAVILFLIILAATAIQFRLAKRRVHYG
jgi:multiple sugar transport system permease protein/sn-glycerol 3-phosphate transport system permease protein